MDRIIEAAFLLGPLLIGMTTGPRKYIQCSTKPALQPPGYIFGIAWFLLYILFGVALLISWLRAGRQIDTSVIAQLILLSGLVLWGIVFMRICAPDIAYIFIIALLGMTIGVTLLLFRKKNILSACLLIPLVLWMSFATYLSYMMIIHRT